MSQKKIHVDGTDRTPAVFFYQEEKRLTISGRFISNEKPAFLVPVFSWLDEYAQQAIPLHLEFMLEYLHRENSKYILDMLLKAEKIPNAFACWKFFKHNEAMGEIGQEFSHITKIPFELVQL